MTIVPRYNFQPGTEITLLNRPMSVTGVTENGYSMVGLEDGAATVVTFDRLVEHLKLPGAKVDAAVAATGDRLKQRLGGYFSSKALKNPEQRALARFHHAMCKALDIYVAKRREDDPKFEASGPSLNADRAVNSSQHRPRCSWVSEFESTLLVVAKSRKIASSTRGGRSIATTRTTRLWFRVRMLKMP